MAVATSKAPYQTQFGMGPTQNTMVSPYNPSHRKPVAANGEREYPHGATFMSQTESEFSESIENNDSIR